MTTPTTSRGAYATFIALMVLCAMQAAPITCAHHNDNANDNANVTVSARGIKATPKHSVVLIHGMVGAILEAKLNIPADYPLPHSNCPRSWDKWTRLWIDGVNLELPKGDCYFEYMSMALVNGTVVNKVPGVTTRVPKKEEGSVFPMDTLDPELVINHFSHEFNPLIKELEKSENGYVQESTLFGISYDWRTLPTLSEPGWLEYATGIIEKAYSATGSPVVLVSHSMGGLVARNLFAALSPEWRQKYIKEWVSVAAPFGGSSREIQAIISGYTFGLPIPASKMKSFCRTGLAGFTLLPQGELFGSQVLATHPSRNYTSADYRQLFVDAKLDVPQSNFFYDTANKFNNGFEYPKGVNMTCIYSKGVKTAFQLHYDDKWELKGTTDVSGDGTVPESSGQWMCNKWQKAGNGVQIQTLDNISHLKTLAQPLVFNAVLNAVK